MKKIVLNVAFPNCICKITAENSVGDFRWPRALKGFCCMDTRDIANLGATLNG